MSRLFKFLFSTYLLVLSCSLYAAAVDYQASVDEINKRLNHSLEIYRSGDAAKAKSVVQGAYFDLYEGLEGGVRVNYPRQASYAIEARFGELRKQIAAQAPVTEIEESVNWLIGQLEALPAVLEAGHQLVAETQSTDQSSILPYWAKQTVRIEALVNSGLASYRKSQNGTPEEQEKLRQRARQQIQQAQFESYKNSDLEAAIRTHRSLQQAATYNDQFKEMGKLASQPFSPRNLVAFGYEVATLTENLKDDIQNLPALDTGASAGEQVADQQEQQDWQQVSSDIYKAITRAIDTYKSGDTDNAIAMVQDSYFDYFEASGMENAVGAHNADLKTTIEGHFTRLVSQMRSGEDPAVMIKERAALEQDLQKGAELLGKQAEGGWALFLASLTIILREGLEALLIVAAIVAYLVKNGHQDKLNVVKNAVGVGLLGSLVTAGIFQWLLTNAGVGREFLEGVTMLIATVVMFSMSYWLLSKAEAQNWKKHLESKLSDSLSSGSVAALWFACFLAVYREGAETVLFYFALGINGSMESVMHILAGLGCGIVVLALVYFIMRFSVVRLPFKPFFLFTGSFMYLMAFAFAGGGVKELVEAGIVQPTLVQGFPQISLLGIYPYVETLLPQSVLLVAAIIALVVMRYQSSNRKSLA
ncbi:FTR1 family iron permease [Sansalvadorimonas verongulae]|uniref:FTR1 family iron permease n=1 Tax=Sansalvadorimonas verongulae TaxID=2172824 RepID=UPI0012BCAEDD|nr:FTR1 family protein [Sansalvadorimonas verongulae]MTI15399.1 FTR1 family iron permease [Sansalvadorimonas verongulae]